LVTDDQKVILSQKILFRFNGELIVNFHEAEYSQRSEDTQKTLDVIEAAVQRGAYPLSYSIALLCLEVI
jgi:hypothetical protein